MGVIAKIKGTIEESFGIAGGAGPGSAGFSYLVALTGGVPSIRNGEDSDYSPLRVKDDAGDADSCMTRGAISALVGGTDSIKWIQVPFSVSPGVGGLFNFTSTATIPNNSIILDARVLVSTVYDAGNNILTVGYTGAGSVELFTAPEVDIDATASAGDITIQQYVEDVAAAGPYNVHVQVQQDGGSAPNTGAGVVLVGYVEAPLT